MNAKNLLIASLVGSALSVIFSTVPVLNFTNCLLCAPYWAGAILAVWIYKRLNGWLTLGQGVVIGLAAGVLASVVSLALSLFGLVNTAELMNKVQSVVSSDIDIPVKTGFNFNCSIGVEVIFGIIGGLIGGALFRTDKAVPPSTEPLKPMNL
ncbi:MAG: hypothetical protein JW748_15950 [Anaerolineales bacterium]|nr:hypothetical protein [Anaerolineales bacterium]